MRIISQFKDYYDSVQKMGFSVNDITWIRQRKDVTKEIKNNLLNMLHIETTFNTKNTNDQTINLYTVYDKNHNPYRPILFFIAGKCYPFFKGINIGKPDDRYSSYKELSEKVNKLCLFYVDFLTEKYVKNIFSLRNRIFKVEPWLYIDSPIFIVELISNNHVEITINPQLSEYQFQNILNPYSIFQEIEMFLGNSLIKENTIPEIPDFYKIQEKGFDNKISFRKRK